MRPYQFWTYMLTNWKRTVLYTGITNNLAMRLLEHWIGKEGCFTTKYKVHYLVWCEETKYVNNAIALEKTLKDWNRQAKEALITSQNPEWAFWNERVLGNWPPTESQLDAVRTHWRKVGDAEMMKDQLSFLRQISRDA